MSGNAGVSNLPHPVTIVSDAAVGNRFGFVGVMALVVGHCAGMIDLVALPVWVGALIERYGFSPQQAGGLATAFLLGAVAASLTLAPQLRRLNGRIVAAAGFATGAIVFALASQQSAFLPLFALHFLAGIAIGSALSMVHGTIGLTANPHRTFAVANMAIGPVAILFLAVVPQILIAQGGPALFLVFAAVMAVAAAVCVFFFPRLPANDSVTTRVPLSRGVWFMIVGISLMTYNQAMVFSFVEVIGKAKGFAPEAVLGVLIALGIVNFILPAPLAALLEKRIPAIWVVRIGPGVQAAFALVLTMTTVFALWAPVAALFVAVQIFTHTFAFGLLARLDKTGRAVAATPAMLMIGSALGPVVGGSLGQTLGFAALGVAALLVSALSIFCFGRARAG